MYQDYIPLISKWFEELKISGEAIPVNYGQVSEMKPDHIHLQELLSEFINKMEGNYPFHLPEYAGQMLKPPHPVAWLAYTLAMSINPNNHALDGGPPSSEMEKEVIEWIAEMVEYPPHCLGHLTSGGTVANLEALWIAGKLHQNKVIAFSEQAHYTHKRMCDVLGIQSKIINFGIFDADETKIQEQLSDVGTIVVTLGTTGTGCIEPLDKIIKWCIEYGIRVHVDAAYGGFFKLIEHEFTNLAPWKVLKEADSIVIDPHKHGLQPYGCGCILFKDNTVGRFYKHDSPYTYFSSKELHLGEITLECSRAGASAAALWFTIKALGLKSDSFFGKSLKASILAARKFALGIRTSNHFQLLQEPDTDIVCYYPKAKSVSEITKISETIFKSGMESEENRLYVSLYKIDAKKVEVLNPDILVDESVVTILRSVFMKPSHHDFVDELIKRLHNIRNQLTD
jgi:glutamate/tyrosine decarboxylase-like PLP-dependent enzyme